MIYWTALKLFWSVANSVLGFAFGQKYKRIVRTVDKVYAYANKVYYEDPIKADNRRNLKYNRLDKLKELLASLQNRVESLERQVDKLQLARMERDFFPPPPPPPPPTPSKCNPPSMPQIQKKSIPVPPPPPPPPFCGPAPPMINRCDDKVILKAVRHNVKDEIPILLEAKRSKPSSADLIQGKEKLRSTSVRRSPGGTPMTGWNAVQIDISSPEDTTTASVMKKALKRKFKNLRPFTPPSPIEGSDGEEFSF